MIEENIKTYETFFGEGTADEQLYMRELAEKLNIKHNDAIWIIVYVFNYFGRFYSDLPQRVESSAENLLTHVKDKSAAIVREEVESTKGELAAAVVNCANSIASRQSLISYITAAAAFSVGIFCLCLICFVAGAAVAGKGWGRTPFTALLHAPAGWILPICTTPITIFRGIHAYKTFCSNKNKKEFVWLIGCFLLISVSILMILYML